jgi:hypothetical protein
MNNKYYLKSVKLIFEKHNGTSFYECKYSNGLEKKFIFIPFNDELKIDAYILEDIEYHKTEIELTNDFKDINTDKNGYRNIKTKIDNKTIHNNPFYLGEINEEKKEIINKILIKNNYDES